MFLIDIFGVILLRRRRFIRPRRRFLRRHLRRRRRIARRTFRRIVIGSTILLALAGTTTAVKLHRRDVERIQDETGKAPEEMTEEELTKAMKQMGIRSMELTPDEKLRVERESAMPPKSLQGGKCPNCGVPILGDENFCGSCGQPL
ncbi:MAG: zinc-ribbon domain-containing protein [Candidatus Hodarchaeota archaeon]